MITIKNKVALQRMKSAGQSLADLFSELTAYVVSGVTTADINSFIDQGLKKRGMKSKMKGYLGYGYVSCISLNDEVVHGVPSVTRIVKPGDLVKIDVCASLDDYCADMARPFFIGAVSQDVQKLCHVAQEALDNGIRAMVPGARLGDVSASIQQVVDKAGFGIVRDFAGHGIGKQMHEDPEILNYGEFKTGVVLRPGMAFALEPMITTGADETYIGNDGWTVYTKDGSLAAHVEDTVIITPDGPDITTRVK